MHLLSVVRHGLGLTLRQQAVSDKTNEIGAVQSLLTALVLEGGILTMDALRNACIGLLCINGFANIADACRYHAAQPKQALALLGL